MDQESRGSLDNNQELYLRISKSRYHKIRRRNWQDYSHGRYQSDQMGCSSVVDTKWSPDISQIWQWHIGQRWKQIQSAQIGDTGDADSIVQTGVLCLWNILHLGNGHPNTGRSTQWHNIRPARILYITMDGCNQTIGLHDQTYQRNEEYGSRYTVQEIPIS